MQHEHEFGKRSRVTPTRAGVVKEIFYICYYCPEEFTEQQFEKMKG